MKVLLDAADIQTKSLVRNMHKKTVVAIEFANDVFQGEHAELFI